MRTSSGSRQHRIQFGVQVMAVLFVVLTATITKRLTTTAARTVATTAAFATRRRIFHPSPSIQQQQDRSRVPAQRALSFLQQQQQPQPSSFALSAGVRHRSLLEPEEEKEDVLAGTDDDDDDDDLLKWERLYQEGERRKAASPLVAAADTTSGAITVTTPDSLYNKNQNSMSGPSSSEVRVVSFDLDNTLWNTSHTIQAANDALADFLGSLVSTTPESIAVVENGTATSPPPLRRVEKIMGDLWKQSKVQYAPVEGEEAKAPVLLTQLRKDAIRIYIQQQNGDSSETNKNDDLVDRAFQIWADARHAATLLHTPANLLECMTEIQSLRTSTGHPIVIGAITDGNSDPTLIAELRDFFAFCVNAESVGVSKPDKRVFLQAVQQLMEQNHPIIKEIKTTSQNQNQQQSAEDILGPWWVHIGDDFIKDVVASKSLRMRSVWSRELILHKFQQQTPQPQKKQSSSPNKEDETEEKSVEQLVKQVSEMKIVQMQVGADDYLADSLQKEFCDAVIDRFADLGPLLNGWHTEAQLQQSAIPTTRDGDTMETVISVEQESAVDVSSVLSPPPPSMEVTPPPSSSSTNTKFCIFCGEKLPALAKFCSACGKKQDV